MGLYVVLLIGVGRQQRGGRGTLTVTHSRSLETDGVLGASQQANLRLGNQSMKPKLDG